MDKKDKPSPDLLLSLMAKRNNKDLDEFFDQLYNEIIIATDPKGPIKKLLRQQADIIDLMIAHFIEKEEFEKCDRIKHFIETK